MGDHPLVQLTLARMREFYREPEALFWVFGFPIVLAFALGIAFQIADDILDATATSAQLGKTAGRDAALAKSTFVSILGVGAARAEAERLAAQAVDRLRQAALVSPTLVALAHYIVTRTN